MSEFFSADRWFFNSIAIVRDCMLTHQEKLSLKYPEVVQATRMIYFNGIDLHCV